MDREDPGPENLRDVGALEQAECQHGRGKGAQLQHRRQDEVDEKNLDEQRGVAHELQIGPGRKPAEDRAGKPHEGRRQADQEGQHEAHGGDLQGDSQSPQQRPEHDPGRCGSDDIRRDPVPLPVIPQALCRVDHQRAENRHQGRTFKAVCDDRPSLGARR